MERDADRVRQYFTEGIGRMQRHKGADLSGLAAAEAVEVFDFRALFAPAVCPVASPQGQAAA